MAEVTQSLAVAVAAVLVAGVVDLRPGGCGVGNDSDALRWVERTQTAWPLRKTPSHHSRRKLAKPTISVGTQV